MDNNIIATINNTLTRTKHMQGSDLVSLADKPRSLLLFENEKRFMEGGVLGTWKIC